MKLFITSIVCLTAALFSNVSAVELIPSKNVKIVIFAPESHADLVREAMGNAGAGKIGNYDFCSFTMKGVGRWRANNDANPAVGRKGVIESSEEERIEAIIPIEFLEEMIAAVKKVHPYEEMGYDIYPLLEIQR